MYRYVDLESQTKNFIEINAYFSCTYFGSHMCLIGNLPSTQNEYISIKKKPNKKILRQEHMPHPKPNTVIQTGNDEQCMMGINNSCLQTSCWWNILFGLNSCTINTRLTYYLFFFPVYETFSSFLSIGRFDGCVNRDTRYPFSYCISMYILVCS